jgi:hypothetical protein
VKEGRKLKLSERNEKKNQRKRKIKTGNGRDKDSKRNIDRNKVRRSNSRNKEETAPFTYVLVWDLWFSQP